MRPIQVVSVLVLASASAFGWRAIGAGGGGHEPPLEPPAPSNSAFAAVLLRLGLGAESLAAAGVTAQEASSVVAAVEQAHSAAALDLLDFDYAEARRTHDALARKVRSGRGSAQDKTALQASAALLATARAAREQYLEAAREAGLTALGVPKASLVRRIRANATWGLPTQYLARDRSEADWVALRSLVATQRISGKDEEESFPQEAAAALAAIDAEPETSTAKAYLETNLHDVQTSWNTAAEGQ